MIFDTFDDAKPRFLNRGKKRRSVSTLSPSAELAALSLSKGIPRAPDWGVEWVDFLSLLKFLSTLWLLTSFRQ